MNTKLAYWIAINGASCARTSMPLRHPKVTPTPQQLIGFPTLEEAEEAQRICLQAPMKEVKRFLKSLQPDVTLGRIRVIQPAHPQPPTRGPTAWTDGDDLVHEIIQKIHIQSTAN